MRKIIQLVIVLLLTNFQGFSNCPAGGLYFWPTRPTIYENSIFIIDGYGLSREIVKELGKAHKIYLRSGEQKINLKVQEILDGQFGQTQAILKPEIPLLSGQEYELIIENLGVLDQRVSRYNPETKQTEKIKWTVGNAKDSSLPRWINKPVFKNAAYEEFSCGDEAFANFMIDASDSSEFIVKTTVKNVSTGKETTYYLTTNKNVVSVGHGMCWGAFNFRGSENFEVEFSLLDASGNLAKQEGERIRFKKPI